MPVAARNRHHDAAVAPRTASPRPLAKPAPAKPAHDLRRASRARVETTAEPDWQSVEPLLGHFNSEDEQSRATRIARRKARRAHRPLRWSWPVAIVSLLLLSHLVALLWLHGCALAVRNRDDKLTRQVQQASNDVNQIHEQIASLSSPRQLDEWARKGGWHKAAQADFDDVTKPAQVRWSTPPDKDGKPDNDSPTRARVEIEVQREEVQREGELR